MKNRTGIYVSFLLLSLAGCSTLENVNDATLVSKNNYVERVVMDSVFVHDSVFIREKADTVFYTKYLTLYKEKVRIDTIMCRDTVFHEREIVVEGVAEKSGTHGFYWKIPLMSLLLSILLLLMWRSGALRFIWKLILKGRNVCIRVFRLRG